MLQVWMGRAKTGKSARILQRIRELGDTSQQILIVPEHASHQAEIDLCHVCGNTVSRHAEVLSFQRLADRTLSLTGGAADITLDDGGKLLTLRRCVSELSASLSLYRRPSQKVVFLRELLDLFDEFQCYEITPEILSDRAQELYGVTHDKIFDLSLLYAAYQARLHQNNRDTRDRMAKLCDNLEASNYIFDKDIFIDGFLYFNAQERRVLEILMRQSRSVTVTLLGETGDNFFSPAQKTLARLKYIAKQVGCPISVETMRAAPVGALGHLEYYFFGNGRVYTGDCSSIHILEAETILSETEQTAADILRLVYSGKARFRDIAVAARNIEEYERSVEVVFARFGIPVYLNRRSDILEKPVLSLLNGVLTSITNGYEYEDMFRWLKTGLAGLNAEECDLLENYVLKWEIHGAKWKEEWIENPDGYGVAWNEERKARLSQINQLRQHIYHLLSVLSKSLKSGQTAREKIDALYNFMEHLQLQSVLEEQMHLQSESGRLQQAEETAQLWVTKQLR